MGGALTAKLAIARGVGALSRVRALHAAVTVLVPAHAGEDSAFAPQEGVA